MHKQILILFFRSVHCHQDSERARSTVIFLALNQCFPFFPFTQIIFVKVFLTHSLRCISCIQMAIFQPLTSLNFINGEFKKSPIANIFTTRKDTFVSPDKIFCGRTMHFLLILYSFDTYFAMILLKFHNFSKIFGEETG